MKLHPGEVLHALTEKITDQLKTGGWQPVTGVVLFVVTVRGAQSSLLSIVNAGVSGATTQTSLVMTELPHGFVAVNVTV